MSTLHDRLNVISESQKVPKTRESVKANRESSDALDHAENWRKQLDVKSADRTQSHNEKSYGSKSHAQLSNLNATDAGDDGN